MKQLTKIKTRVFIKRKLKQPQYIQGIQRNLRQQVPLSPIMHWVRQSDNWELGGMAHHLASSALKDCTQIQQNLMKKVQWITSLTIRNGHLTICKDHLLFIYNTLNEQQSHLAMISHQLQENRRLIKTWPLDLLKQIARRRFAGKNTALQLLFLDGISIFINFPNADSQQMAHKLIRLRKTRCPNLYYEYKTLNSRKLIQKDGMMKKWINKQISNFQYLMHLNWLAGRSYKQLTQYPVVPWIISNYHSQKIDYKNPQNYRDLRKPMGALGSIQRTNKFEQRYMNPDISNNTPPFHYGTHYSSAGIIYHFMIRIQPYTLGAKKLQGGHFDIADRLFSQLEVSYNLATTQLSDVRQLIPQFYCLPQMMYNPMNLDLGVNQKGQKIDKVHMPAWAVSAYRFTYQMRKAMESDIVSKMINYWIDLIFGVKQTGKAAQQALNMFYYLTYEDVIDFKQIDQSKRISLQSQIMNFGQTPSLLFSKHHPSRSQRKILTFINSPLIKVFRRTDRKQKPMINQSVFNILRQSSQAIICLKWLDQQRFMSLSRGGQVTYYSWFNQYTGKTPFQCGVGKQKTISRLKQSHNIYEQLDPSLVVSRFPIQMINSGQIAVLGGFVDGLMLLINIGNQHIIQSYRHGQSTISYVTGDGKNFIITGDCIGNIYLYRITAEFRLRLFQMYDYSVAQINSININKQLKCFATGANDGHICIYNIISGKFINEIQHEDSISQLCLSNSPIASVIVINKYFIWVYSVNGSILSRIEQNCKILIGLTIFTDEYFCQQLMVSNEKGEVLMKQLPFLQETKKVLVSKGAPSLSAAITPNNIFLLIGCSDGEISIIAPIHQK